MSLMHKGIKPKKQRSLLDLPKIKKQDVLKSKLLAFISGQLAFLVVFAAVKTLRYGIGRNFDIVVLPGLAKLGFYEYSIGPFKFLVVKTLGTILLNLVLIFLGFVSAQSFGKWIVKWVMGALVIINFAVLIY